MRSEGLTLRWAVALAAFFTATRVVLHFSGLPYFDPDSYKYLTGADALLHGQPLPSLYADLAVNGGALHVVPGYAYFIYAIWSVTGVTIDGITLANSVISFAGYLALAHLLSIWIHRGAGIAVFAVLTLSPSIAWLEHSIMPDAIAAPLLMIAFWTACVGTSALERVRRAAGALASGLILGAEILMRTSSQIYAPLPWLLGIEGARFTRKIGWTFLYAVALIAPLLPWMMQNQERHGVLAPAASTGRNFYFNALYSGTLDIGKELKRYDMLRAPAVPHSAYALSDRALQKEIAGGLSLREADRKLGQIAWEAYRKTDAKTLAKQRLAIAYHLFVPDTDPGTQTLTPLRSGREWYLANTNSSTQIRTMLSERFRHSFSQDYLSVAAQRTPPKPWARDLYTRWIEFLTFDGGALLLAYLAATFVILARARARRQLLVALVLPPALFIVAFSFVQAPLYRYQAGLHPFMLATVVAACATFFTAPRRRALLPPEMKMRRRLDG